MGEELIFKLLQESPWVAMVAFFVYRNAKSMDYAVKGYERLADGFIRQSESINGLSSTMQSMEKGLGILQRSVQRTEEGIDALRREIRP